MKKWNYFLVCFRSLLFNLNCLSKHCWLFFYWFTCVLFSTESMNISSYRESMRCAYNAMLSLTLWWNIMLYCRLIKSIDDWTMREMKEEQKKLENFYDISVNVATRSDYLWFWFCFVYFYYFKEILMREMWWIEWWSLTFYSILFLSDNGNEQYGRLSSASSSSWTWPGGETLFSATWTTCTITTSIRRSTCLVNLQVNFGFYFCTYLDFEWIWWTQLVWLKDRK